MDRNYDAIIFKEGLGLPVLLASSKLEPCLLKQPLKTRKKVKRIRNYVLKVNLYLYFLIY